MDPRVGKALHVPTELTKSHHNRARTMTLPRRIKSIVPIGLLTAAFALTGCESRTQPSAPFLDLPRAFCCERAPSSHEEDLIAQALANIQGVGDPVCDAAVNAGYEALQNGNISIDETGYDGITHWIGQHPSDSYGYTTIGNDFVYWPPYYLEIVLAHEFIHSSQHMHMDQEDQVEAMAEDCVIGG